MSVTKGKAERGIQAQDEVKRVGFPPIAFSSRGAGFPAGLGWSLLQSAGASVGILWTPCPNSKPTLSMTRPGCRQKTTNKQKREAEGLIFWGHLE